MQPWELSGQSERRVKDNRHWPMEITTVECFHHVWIVRICYHCIVLVLLHHEFQPTWYYSGLKTRFWTWNNIQQDWKSTRGYHGDTQILRISIFDFHCFSTLLKFWWRLLHWLVWLLQFVQGCLLFLILYSMMYNEGRPTVKWWLVLPLFECPKWPLPLVVLPPHAHDHPDMHTSLLSNHPGVGQQQQELT